MEVNNTPEELPVQSSYERFLQYLEHQGDWLERTRGNLLVSASIIATMSFGVITNPPGGVWPRNGNCTIKGQAGTCKVRAGTSIFSNDVEKRGHYVAMIISSLISFSASMGIIFLVVMGFRFRNRIIMAIMVVFMMVAVLCISAAIYFCAMLVHGHDIVYNINYYVRFWAVFPVCVLLIQLVRFLWWVIRFKCCSSR